jgi:hypothetical protein
LGKETTLSILLHYKRERERKRQNTTNVAKKERKRERETDTHRERERERKKINQITSFLKLFCWISIKECTFKCCEIFLKV